MIFRPNTYDESIWGDSTERNAYGLPEKLPEGSIIIDIGCHIGSFSYEAAKRGASKIYAFEASLENYKIASQNLKEYINSGVVELFHLAVWDKPDEEITLNTGEVDTLNTGGYSLFKNWWSEATNEKTLTTTLDIILKDYIKLQPVEIIKFDCEGSEYKIFYSSRMFDQYVKRMVGETHTGENIGSTAELIAYFESKGYKITNTNNSEEAHLGWIDAIKI